MRRTSPLLVLLAALAVLPTAQAVPTTLYAHVWDLQDFVLSTQAPPEDFAVDLGQGTFTTTLTCLPDTLPSGATDTDYHTRYGYYTPGPVDYGVMDDEVRVAPERGMQVDARLDPAAPLTLHWYLSEPKPREGGQPTPTPNVVVRATMRAGDSISIDDESYNSGPILAQGGSVPATLAGPASQGVEVSSVDGRTVYHFSVPMAIQDPVIPRATGFNLRVDTFVESPTCPDGGLMPNSVLLHSSHDHRPRLEANVLDPLKLEYLHPEWVGEDLVVHTSVLDPWGSPDVVAVNLTIEGPGLPPTPLVRAANIRQTYEHRSIDNGVDVTWVGPGMASLPPGAYTLRFTVHTLQGHSQTWDSTFQWGAEQEMPALPAGLLLLGVAALAAALRRR